MPVPYPLQLELHADLHITRWRPLVQWLLAIPHLMIGYALRTVRQVLTLVSFFTVLFTEQIPRPALQVPSYRRSSDQRRQQLKWLYAGGTVFLVSVLLEIFVVPLALRDAAGSGPPVVNDLFSLTAAALPVCIGVAVLKYRLYAIDRIISRVISYTIITVVLAGGVLRAGDPGHRRAAVQDSGSSSGLHASLGSAVQPAAAPGAAGSRPAVQPCSLRCRPDRGCVRGAAEGRGGSGLGPC